MGISLTKLDSSKIEKVGYDYLRPLFDVGDAFVMGGSRNSSVNEDKQVYFNCPIEIKDRNAYGQTVSRIEVYVKKLSGYKNATELSRIRDVLIEKFQEGIRLGDYWFEYDTEINGDDRAGFDFIFINLATKIL